MKKQTNKNHSWHPGVSQMESFGNGENPVDPGAWTKLQTMLALQEQLDKTAKKRRRNYYRLGASVIIVIVMVFIGKKILQPGEDVLTPNKTSTVVVAPLDNNKRELKEVKIDHPNDPVLNNGNNSAVKGTAVNIQQPLPNSLEAAPVAPVPTLMISPDTTVKPAAIPIVNDAVKQPASTKTVFTGGSGQHFTQLPGNVDTLVAMLNKSIPQKYIVDTFKTKGFVIEPVDISKLFNLPKSDSNLFRKAKPIIIEPQNVLFYRLAY